MKLTSLLWLSQLTAPLAALTLGLVLLLLRRSRRVGDAPHCRRCDYDLSGGQADRCPECGSSLLPARAVARGQRATRQSFVVIGSLAVALGAVWLARSVQPLASRNFWLHLTPTSWLVERIRGAEPRRWTDAWQELDARRARRELSPADIDALASAVTENIASSTMSREQAHFRVRRCLELFGDGAFRKEHVQELLKRCVTMKLVCRPVIVSGVRTCVILEVEEGLLSELYTLHVSIETISVDGAPVLKPDAGGVKPPFRRVYSWSAEVGFSTLTPGPHRMVADVNLSLHRPVVGPERWMMQREPESPPLVTTTALVACDFEFDEEMRADYTRLHSSPNEDRYVRETLADAIAKWSRLRIEEGTVKLEFDRLPRPGRFDYAFDVYLAVDGSESYAGAIVYSRHSEWTESSFRFAVAGELAPVARLTVILRSSVDRAAEACGTFAIWYGEIRAEFPVEARQPRKLFGITLDSNKQTQFRNPRVEVGPFPEP